MRWMRLPVLAGVLMAAAAGVQAGTVTWTWQFATEKGTFTTDGALSGGVAPAGTYHILDFSVVSSAGFTPGSLGGGQFSEGSQPGTGFAWNGSAATMFFRDGGTLTNGANFYSVPGGFRISFYAEPGLMTGSVSNPSETTLIQSTPLALRPVQETTSEVPEPGSLALLGAGLVGIAALRWRR